MPDRFVRFVLALVLFALATPRCSAAAVRPPVAPVEPVTDTYGTTSIVDPYRWMERSSADQRFLPLLHAENAYTAALLAPLAAERDALRARLQAASAAVAHAGGWHQAGGRIFYEELAPGAAVAALRVRDADGASRTLFDPATFAGVTSHAAINYSQPSIDGTYVAVGVALGGSELTTLRIVDARTGALLPDAISRTDYGSPSWRTDGRSFYYARLQAVPAGAPPTAKYENGRVFLHVLGTDPDRDRPVFGPGVPGSPALAAYGFNYLAVVPGTRALLAVHSTGTTDPPSSFLSHDDGATWSTLIAPSEHVATGGSSPLAIRGSKAYVFLQNVPNGRIVSYDLTGPAPPRTIVPESSKLIEGIFGTADALYVEYRDGLHVSIEKFDDAGRAIGTIPLPFAGSLAEIDASPTERGLRFGLDSWTRSIGLYSYDPASDVVADTGVIAKDPADVSHFVAREVSAPTTDGASVPISIIVRDDAALDGSHPTLFEGYGAYGISIDPAFSASQLEWVRRGGVLAFAHVRGGGEFGESWHAAGQKQTKQHTVDDMIATARYLIAQKYTSPAHLAVRGTSAGGIAVGGAIVQHPELFAAAVDNVGMTDLLRSQLTPGGPANVPEFGDSTKAADFAFMYPLDAYERVKDGTAYPAVMGVTGVNDPRVSTWIVAKMISRLQAASSSGKPVVLRADFDAGHGIGSSRTQAIAERADEWTFLLWQLGDPEFQPKRP